MWKKNGLLSQESFDDSSKETQERIDLILDINRYHSSAGDSQGRARLNYSACMKVIKYLNGHWKPWLILTGALGVKTMRKPIIYRYRVDKVPIIIQPQFLLYGYSLGLLLFFYLLILRATTKVKIFGREALEKNPNHIFSMWHSFVPLGLTIATPTITKVLDRAPQAWMQHPIWYMKPIHVLLRLMGVNKIILGSTGHSGRDAAELLVDYLRMGYSTVINPDGPNGPAFILKKGILHLSLQSNVPIVPLRFSSSGYRELRTWDRKKIVRLFSTIEMKIGDPIYVTNDNFDHAHKLLAGKMG